jgi:hypothetical protein
VTQALLEQQAQLEELGTLVQLAQLEELGTLVQLAPLAQLDGLVGRVQQVFKDVLVPPGSQDQQEGREIQDLLDLREKPVQLDLQDRLVKQEQQVYKEQQVSLV